MRSILVRALAVALAIGGAGAAFALPMLVLGGDADSPTRFAHALDPLAPEQKSTVIRIPAAPARESAHRVAPKPKAKPAVPAPAARALPQAVSVVTPSPSRPAAPTRARPTPVTPKPSTRRPSPSRSPTLPLPRRRRLQPAHSDTGADPPHRRRSRHPSRRGALPARPPAPAPVEEPAHAHAHSHSHAHSLPPTPIAKAERAGDGTPQETNFRRGGHHPSLHRRRPRSPGADRLARPYAKIGPCRASAPRVRSGSPSPPSTSGSASPAQRRMVLSCASSRSQGRAAILAARRRPR
jgi:hypothetical protein